MDACAGRLSVPRYCLVARPPYRTLISDGSKPGVGGFCFETNCYWPYALSEEHMTRFIGSSKQIQSQDFISINALDQISRLISAHMMVGVCGERPVGDEDCAWLRGDNETTVHQVRRVGR